MHVADLGSIPGISYSPLKLSGVTSKCSKVWPQVKNKNKKTKRCLIPCVVPSLGVGARGSPSTGPACPVSLGTSSLGISQEGPAGITGIRVIAHGPPSVVEVFWGFWEWSVATKDLERNHCHTMLSVNWSGHSEGQAGWAPLKVPRTLFSSLSGSQPRW